jgi:hypothetical protein
LIEADRLVEIRTRIGQVALGAERNAAVVMQNGEIDRRVAAGIDQRRAGSDALLDGRAPLPGAAPFISRRILRARRQRGEQKDRGNRQPAPITAQRR